MCDYCSYIETAKDCPKCKQRTLFFCIIIVDSNIPVLGVKCKNPECNFKVKVYQKEE